MAMKFSSKEKRDAYLADLRKPPMVVRRRPDGFNEPAKLKAPSAQKMIDVLVPPPKPSLDRRSLRERFEETNAKAREIDQAIAIFAQYLRDESEAHIGAYSGAYWILAIEIVRDNV